ncbi:MAG: hypothetical protein HC873_09805 [Leptolyngbyaceae cyanobacterium SL_1_1]|nr:hypothetical protein [Leptolyngbyaceae cyanobacterium SL_1_1]
MLLVLLTRILLWAALGLIIWYVLLKFIPRNYLTWFGGLIFLALLVLSFLETDDPTITIIWNIISFPLKPLGAAITLLAVALSQGVKKIVGNQVALALVILLVASMPLVARFWLDKLSNQCSKLLRIGGLSVKMFVQPISQPLPI